MKKSIYIWVLVFFLTLFSCEKGFDELNQNPNSPLAGSPQELFAFAQREYHTHYEHGILTEIWGLNSWLQIQADINGGAIGDNYVFTGDALNTTWRVHYATVLGNVNEAIRLTNDKPEKVNENSIYRIFRAYVFHRITDLWGDIPYFEAHNVFNEENIPEFTPVYDSQQSIYLDLFKELKEAKNALNSQMETLTVQDWMYNGDIGLWRKFANGLRLRLALRISDVSPDISSMVINELLLENDFFQSNLEGAFFPHSSASRNPFYALETRGEGMYNPSKYLLDKLNEDNDPRTGNYAEPSPESFIFGTEPYVGVESFLLASEIDPGILNSFTTSYVGDYFLEADLPGPLLTYAEINFLLSEAALKGYSTPLSAEEHYYTGVRAHMEEMELDTQEIDEFIANDGAFDGTLENIITEKWKTMVYTNAIEIFSEYRRTGFPILLDAEGDVVQEGVVPLRFAYPSDELSFNSDNVSAVGVGINDYYSPVWWDK